MKGRDYGGGEERSPSLSDLSFLHSLVLLALPPFSLLPLLQEGVRLALLLSGGGEFAFVLLALAEKLGLVPVGMRPLLNP